MSVHSANKIQFSSKVKNQHQPQYSRKDIAELLNLSTSTIHNMFNRDACQPPQATGATRGVKAHFMYNKGDVISWQQRLANRTQVELDSI